MARARAHRSASGFAWRGAATQPHRGGRGLPRPFADDEGTPGARSHTKAAVLRAGPSQPPVPSGSRHSHSDAPRRSSPRTPRSKWLPSPALSQLPPQSARSCCPAPQPRPTEARAWATSSSAAAAAGHLVRPARRSVAGGARRGARRAASAPHRHGTGPQRAKLQCLSHWGNMSAAFPRPTAAMPLQAASHRNWARAQSVWQAAARRRRRAGCAPAFGIASQRLRGAPTARSAMHPRATSIDMTQREGRTAPAALHRHICGVQLIRITHCECRWQSHALRRRRRHRLFAGRRQLHDEDRRAQIRGGSRVRRLGQHGALCMPRHRCALLRQRHWRARRINAVSAMKSCAWTAPPEG